MIYALLRLIRETLGLGKLYNALVKTFIGAVENGYVPDFILRTGIRFLLSNRVAEVRRVVCGRNSGAVRMRGSRPPLAP